MRRRVKKKVKLSFILVVLLALIIGLYYRYNYLKDSSDKEINVDNNEIIEKPAPVKLTLVGDFLFEQPFYDDIKENDTEDIYFRRVNTKYFDADDITIGNMEVPIGSDSMKVSGEGFNFCAPSSIGELISKQSIELLGTANNHTYDRGIEGVYSTKNFFKNNSNILTVGSYLNENDRNTPRIITKNGIKFGFLAYTYGTNIGVPNEYISNIGFFDGVHKEKMTEEVNKLRKEVDVLVVLMHWGYEFTYKPGKQQTDFANYLNSLNVDIIVGSHSHCMQPIEWIGEEHKTLVYYSMGNFVSADDDISRTPKGQEEFDNSYQVGLLSTLEVSKEDDNIKIDNIKTEPIVNYFDKNLRHFELIPFSQYTDEYEKSHYRYSFGMSKDFITKTYNSVISSEFRKN